MYKGLGKSGGWGRGPAAFGRLLYAISQHEMATATATNASKVVMIKEMMRPSLGRQTLSISSIDGPGIERRMDFSMFYIYSDILLWLGCRF